MTREPYRRPPQSWAPYHLARRFLLGFELDDDEAIRWTLNLPFPWKVWLVLPRQDWRQPIITRSIRAPKLGERYPTGWRHWWRHRIRVQWCSLLLERLVRKCPGCARRFTLGELLKKGQRTTKYRSGTRWHRLCLETRAVVDEVFDPGGTP